ncbi:dTDP-4-dehydrorhamnose reductase [Hoeflea sp.]|uniref:dTDP-4-dehydrorhamnose reductase n=1 Tax=Hoeflea sp. TaxID=1940281 RepID=UPI0019966F5A|nr:dTDP-4-dehydrorhamnose reductase [Hoeflea sp.]MBC7285043.1 dTDP-4-dehydrorhamnose reductase [Hoeflea sp.]
MRIAVTGTQGQLVRCLTDQAAALSDVTIVAVGRPDVDLADGAAIEAALMAIGADIVINAAAYTAVDQAESESDSAFAINRDGAAHVARVANQMGVPVIQVSTDYVFDGTLPRAYVPDDATGPVSVYGASKLAGEAAVRAENPRHIIVRTAWVYSPYGKNFVKTMLRVAGDRDEISVVDDQKGNPTSAHDLASGLLVAARAMTQPGFDAWGTFHMAGQGDATWADFAEHVLAESARLGGPSARVIRIPGSSYKTPAPRPANSRLDCSTTAQVFGYSTPDWRASASQVVASLLQPTRAE